MPLCTKDTQFFRSKLDAVDVCSINSIISNQFMMNFDFHNG